jgi:pimeloyl-ACP methyl ester carboxylesterase
MLYHKTFRHEDSQKDWVTFVHGAGGSSSIWFKQVKAFAKYFNVLLIDLRGHGQSSKGDESRVYSFKEITSEVIEVLDHLKIEKSNFVGISLGTIIIREIAESAPSRVKNMVLGGAILNFNLRGKILMRLGDWFKTLIPYMLLYKLFAFVILPRKNHQEARSLFINEAKKLAQKEFVRWYKLTASVNRVLKIHRDKPVNAPTLYVMGSEDYMFLEPIRDVIKNQKQAILRVIENCGHVVNVEQPLQFNEIVLDYLLNQSGETQKPYLA